MKRQLENRLTLCDLASQEAEHPGRELLHERHYPLLETLHYFAQSEPVIKSDPFVYEISFREKERELLIFISRQTAMQLVFRRDYADGIITANDSFRNPPVDDLPDMFDWLYGDELVRKMEPVFSKVLNAMRFALLVGGYACLLNSGLQLFKGNWSGAVISFCFGLVCCRIARNEKIFK